MRNSEQTGGGCARESLTEPSDGYEKLCTWVRRAAGLAVVGALLIAPCAVQRRTESVRSEEKSKPMLPGKTPQKGVASPLDSAPTSADGPRSMPVRFAPDAVAVAQPAEKQGVPDFKEQIHTQIAMFPLQELSALTQEIGFDEIESYSHFLGLIEQIQASIDSKDASETDRLVEEAAALMAVLREENTHYNALKAVYLKNGGDSRSFERFQGLMIAIANYITLLLKD
ncbi:hypothetical protein IPJ72_05180 [Candidatus Peregrinibacteria bacterium]|nr:MAG: hypothetical protein IPJ72_05180 [Candidatus Peregrinibacteria bacterium]